MSKTVCCDWTSVEELFFCSRPHAVKSVSFALFLTEMCLNSVSVDSDTSWITVWHCTSVSIMGKWSDTRNFLWFTSQNRTVPFGNKVWFQDRFSGASHEIHHKARCCWTTGSLCDTKWDKCFSALTRIDRWWKASERLMGKNHFKSAYPLQLSERETHWVSSARGRAQTATSSLQRKATTVVLNAIVLI